MITLLGYFIDWLFKDEYERLFTICPHDGDKTDMVVNVACTCETIYTICDDCDEVLNIKTDC